jgi:Uma2 family endonuclease
MRWRMYSDGTTVRLVGDQKEIDMIVTEKLITADEFGRMEDNGRPSELVRGRIVQMNVPAARHGFLCFQISHALGRYLDANKVGRVFCNDAGVVTERDPDSVRGPDVCFVSYERLPRGELPDGYLTVIPELVFEVRSPSDRRSEILAKVAEYLNAGVKIVCVVDPVKKSVRVYTGEEEDNVLTADQELDLSEVLSGFKVPVRSFFE